MHEQDDCGNPFEDYHPVILEERDGRRKRDSRRTEKREEQSSAKSAATSPAASESLTILRFRWTMHTLEMRAEREGE